MSSVFVEDFEDFGRAIRREAPASTNKHFREQSFDVAMDLLAHVTRIDVRQILGLELLQIDQVREEELDPMQCKFEALCTAPREAAF